MTGQGPIVFPTDFSAASLAGLAWAKRMARVLAAPIHVVYAVEQPQVFQILEAEAIQAAWPDIEDLTAMAATRLEAFVAARLDRVGCPVETRVLAGNPAEEIVRYADEVQAAMIVIGAHGYTGVRHLVLGSTTEATLRGAHCPVLCVKAAG